MSKRLRFLAIAAALLAGLAVLIRVRYGRRPDPQTREYLAAQADLEQDRPGSAVHRFEQLIVEGTGSADAYQGLGYAYLQQGEYERAAQALETAVALGPQKPHLFCRLADAYLHLRDRDEAVRAVAAEEKRDARCAYAHLVAGEQWIRDDNLKDALAELQTAIRLSPDAPVPYQRAGYVLLELGRPAEAEPVLLQGLKLAPARPDLHIQLGRLYAGRPGDPTALASAEEHYRLALAGNPRASDILAELGSVAQLRGRPDEARRFWESALQGNRNESKALYGLAQLATQQGRAADARLYRERFQRIKEFQRRVEALRTEAGAHNDRRARVRLTRLCLDAGITEEAERQLAVLMRETPGSAEVHALQGDLDLLEQHPDEAHDEFLLAGRLTLGTAH